MAQAIGAEGSRSEALAALAPRLGPTERDRALREALEAARAIGDEWSRSEALAALALHLAELGRPAEALEATRAIGAERSRSEALAALAPHLGPTERDRALREALEAARAIGDEWSRSEALAALALRLAELGQPGRGAGGGAGYRSREVPVRGAGRAGPALVELGHPAEALEAARAIGDGGSRSEVLAALARAWRS